MTYSRDFFALQLRFAEALATRFGMPVEEALFRYTPFALNFDRETFGETFRAARDPAAWVHDLYQQRRGPEVEADGEFQGRQLFGRFYYVLREGHVVRPHIAPVSPPSGFLSEGERPAALSDLRRMFARIQVEVPLANVVAGNSWLYNLASYRALFPPAFTERMAVSTEDEFHFLALWGQFFDRCWAPRESASRVLLARVARLNAIENLRLCFPLQILVPRCRIEEFYRFYGV